MITKDQALTADRFHYGECKRTVGPRGGVRMDITEFRRNGQTRTWKRQPDRWEIPVKYGMYQYDVITQDTASFHTADDCPLGAQ